MLLDVKLILIRIKRFRVIKTYQVYLYSIKIAQDLDMHGYELLKEIEDRGLLEDLFRTNKRH